MNHFSSELIKRELIAKPLWKPYPQTAAEWKAKLPQNILEGLIKRGEQALGKEIPPLPATLFLEYARIGNRSNFEKNSFARRNQLMDLVLAETIEDKGRFTDAIINYVWAICEETYWGVPAHLSVQKAGNGLPDANDRIIELFGAETAATLALTDYFVGPKLDKVSPLIRKRIYSESSQKIFEPILETGRYGWLDPTKIVNNWNPWIISNVLIANLLLEQKESKRADNVYQYMKLLDIYLNGLGDDGGCDEGPSYWFAAGGSVFDSLEILASATSNRVNIYDEPLIGKMAAYIYKMHIAGDYFVNFADADPKFQGDGLLLYRFGKAVNDQQLSEFGLNLYNRSNNPLGEGFEKPRRLNDLLSVRNLPAAPVAYMPPNDAWFSDIQVLTSRGKAGLFLAAHGGNNGESHNHNDVGDFIIYLGDEPVIIDAGGGNYTSKTFSSKRYELWFTQSENYNLPVINGFGQRAGIGFKASGVKYSTDERQTSLLMDISKSYPKEAGIDFWNRSVKLDRTKNAVEILDEYAFLGDAVSLSEVFMTICDIDVSVAGRIRFSTPKRKDVVLTYDAKNWTIGIEMPPTEGPEYSSFTAKWDNHPIRRIILTHRNPKNKDVLGYSFSLP